jgi:hypothetical protein
LACHSEAQSAEESLALTTMTSGATDERMLRGEHPLIRLTIR